MTRTVKDKHVRLQVREDMGCRERSRSYRPKNENKNGQTQAFGRSERLSSIQTSMSSRMNFSTLHFAPSYSKDQLTLPFFETFMTA